MQMGTSTMSARPQEMNAGRTISVAGVSCCKEMTHGLIMLTQYISPRSFGPSQIDSHACSPSAPIVTDECQCGGF